jgi:hypothetical protein
MPAWSPSVQRTMRRLEQWRSLAPAERRLLPWLAALLPLVGAALRLLGYHRTRALLERLSRPPQRPSPADPGATTTADTAQRLARLVGIAAHHGPYRATCLRQSLALWWLLRRRGIAAELRIGVRKEQGELQAHAWVEHDGQALNDAQDLIASYAAFQPSLPAGTVTQP